jgi:uncharacterized protein
MSEDWSKLRDVDPLADGRVRLDFAIPLAEFPRLRAQLASADGAATGHVSFGREQGFAVGDVEVAARVALICQRCLEPFELALESAGRAALVADAAEADRVPGDFETTLAPGHRVSVRDLVEEELLLALPIVPRHAQECSPRGRPAFSEPPPGEPDATEERHRPFERLDELFNRSK